MGWCPFSARIGPRLLDFLDAYGDAQLRGPAAPLRVALLDVEALPEVALQLGLRATPRLLLMADGRVHRTLDIGPADVEQQLGALADLLADGRLWVRASPRPLQRVSRYRLGEFKAALRIYRFILVDQRHLVDWMTAHRLLTFGSLGGLSLLLTAARLLSR